MYTSYHDNETHDLDVQCRPSRDRDPYTRRNKVKGQTVQKIEWKKTDGRTRPIALYIPVNALDKHTHNTFFSAASFTVCRTATGTHVPYGITVLPATRQWPGRSKAGTRLATPEGCKAELTYGWLHILFFSRPRFFHGESCPCDVVHPGRAWSSFPSCVHLALFLALSLSPGNSLVSS